MGITGHNNGKSWFRFLVLPCQNPRIAMYSLSWTDLLQLEVGDRLLHHSGCFAQVMRVASSRYEDGLVELQLENGTPELLLLNDRTQLEHHLFFTWHLGYRVPKFRAGDPVWCRGDAPGSSREVEGIAPNEMKGFSYYLKGSKLLHPESFLVRASLAA
jgi:hypothetical protein